jgi:tetratricopeptide (TPR) repeat protein
MKKNYISRFLMLVFAVLVSRTFAGPIENARAQLASGEADQVEATLASVLDADPVPLDAIKLSYQAARASGKIYTAERRVRELIEREGEENPEWIYEGALVARDLGQTARSMDRLLFFVRNQKEKSPRLENSLLLLSQNSLFPEAYSTYLRLYPEKADFNTGFRMMQRLRANSQPTTYLELAKTLVENFSNADDQNRVYRDVYDAVRSRMLGLKRDEAYAALFSAKIHNLDILMEMISREGSRPQELMMLQQQFGKPLPRSLLDRFRDIEKIDRDVIRTDLAKRFLSMEPIYRKSGDRDAYRAFVWMVFSQPNAFISESGRVISENQAAEFFRHLYQLHAPDHLNQLRSMGRYLLGDHRDNPNRFVQQPALRKALLQELHAAFRADELVELIKDNERNPSAVEALIQLTGNRQDVRMRLLETLDRNGQAELVARTAGMEMLSKPTNFDERELARYFLNCSALSDQAKVQILQKVYEETGNAARLKRLVNHRDTKVNEKKAFQDFIAGLQENRAPKDPVLAILMEVEANDSLRSGREPKEAFNQKIREAFAAYGAAYPSASVPAQRTQYMERLLELYRNTCDDRTEGRRKYAEVVTPHLSKTADWEAHIEFTIERTGSDGLATYFVAKDGVKILGGYQPAFATVSHPKQDAAPFLDDFYSVMSGDDIKGYLHRNRGVWAPEVLAEQLLAASEHQDLLAGDSWRVVQILEVLRLGVEEKKNLTLPVDEVAALIFKTSASGRMSSSWDMRREVLRLFAASGKTRKGMQKLVEATRKMKDPGEQVQVLFSGLFADRDLIPNGSVEGAFEPGTKLQVLIEEILPKLEKLPKEKYASQHISNDAFRSLNWFISRRELSGEFKPGLNTIRSFMVTALAYGADGDAGWSEFAWAMDTALLNALAKSDYDQVYALINLAGEKADNTDLSRLKQLIKPLQDQERMESLLLVTQLMDTDDPEAKTLLNQIRALAGSEVQGIYPVDKEDPEYPLYVAADELARNNAEQAWNLLRQNLTVFAQDPLQYPLPFTGWALEKLREVKGENNEWFALSRELSNLILTREDELTTAFKARVMLNRAEIFREDQDFESARLEYKTLRSNPELQATPYGRTAMFRDVDLMITMGNTTAAEGLIEYWLSNPDPELQVKAYYFRALMAFNDGDFETTRDNLDQVFELDFTNTEARLLHGKWRLKTNYEIDDPEVVLGTILDRTPLRPGQPLRVSVNDPNLSVVGGGTAIPVIVRTSNGGDLEKLSLFPSTRDPRQFRGSIDTQLAMVKPGNRLLEINGQDVVSYEIDPEFLKLRGMTSGEPKRLQVVDDARLAVSAGSILSEAEQQALEVEQQMSAGASNSGRLVSHVRPGNPFYVMVKDRDRSDGSDENEVTVTASTSSGDEIRQVVLKELAPYSGEFRGEIKTALPPPRASASDSGEGMDPGVVINHTRDGLWRSRSDGVQGKWLKADTMNSFEVKRVELKTPEASRIAQIRLYGSLMGEERLMGTYPERKVSGGGVTVQTAGANLRSLVDYRKLFSESREIPASQSAFEYNVKNRGHRFHLQGAFWMPEDQNLRLRVMPKIESKYPLNDLWIHILVDGEVVTAGRGSDLMKNPIYLTLPQGGHILEVFGVARDKQDNFFLGFEQADGSVIPIPEEWFKTESQPELAEFLKDRATLSRRDGSWVATFKEPERLRSVRWEFVQYAGDSISVTELRIEDENGKPILPTNTDFTDALSNDILEIAPGDQITVRYQDAVTSEGQRKTLSRQLSSQFTNGSLSFFFESIASTTKGIQQTLYDAYRFRPGDDFLVVVEDGDLDVSPGVDRVQIQVQTRSGEQLTLEAVETPAKDQKAGEPVHSNQFRALLRTTLDAATAGNTLRVQQGDRITASYVDRENTSPGIPVSRSTELSSVQRSEPILSLYHTWRELVEDTSDDAQAKLEQIRKRTGNEELSAIKTWSRYGMLMDEETLSQEVIAVNVDVPLPVEVYLPSQAMHRGSQLTLRVLTESEKQRAESEGREPNVMTWAMPLGKGGGGLRIVSNPNLSQDQLRMMEPEPNATFGTSIQFALGTESSMDEEETGHRVMVQGNDRFLLALYNEDKERLFEKKFQLVSEGMISLKDSSYEAGRTKIHLGERFFVEVRDSDQDRTPQMDEVSVEVISSRNKKTETLVLRETMPNSGVFTGVLMPKFLKPEIEDVSGAVPVVEETGTDPNAALVGIPTLEVAFGESLSFSYADEQTLPIREAGSRTVSGTIFEGSDGEVMAFTKYFSDPDMAVRVQFRLAESLFEMAKDYRKLKRTEQSSEAIAEGKRILEEALINYPDTNLAVEGEYLLANLYQEMAAEQAEANPEQSTEFYKEALSRFSAILSSWPDSEFAARSQYHKALCLEKLGDFMRASEEYVKMTYIFPDSPLVGEAAIRLATHYYKNEQRYDTAGKIYSNFYKRFPTHDLAPKALFMGAQSHMKQGEIWETERREKGISEKEVKTERILDEYREAVNSLQELINNDSGTVNNDMRAQAMYWAGDASLRAMDNANAYLFLKRTTFEYPDSEWARRARGLLLQSAEAFEGLQ